LRGTSANRHHHGNREDAELPDHVRS